MEWVDRLRHHTWLCHHAYNTWVWELNARPWCQLLTTSNRQSYTTIKFIIIITKTSKSKKILKSVLQGPSLTSTLTSHLTCHFHLSFSLSISSFTTYTGSFCVLFCFYFFYFYRNNPDGHWFESNVIQSFHISMFIYNC